MSKVNIRSLSVLAYAQGFTHWHYKLGDQTIASALSPGFFDTAKDMINDCDVILISGTDGAACVMATVADGKVSVSKVQ